jgi:hypothetical protein
MTLIIAWGAKVSRTFIDRVMWIVEDLGIGTDVPDGTNKLMTCMAWESDRTFSASVVNKAGSGATGLIQFMPKTARGLGTTTAKLAAMTPEDQLNYVWKYFEPFKGKLKRLSDIYMAILWPKAVGKPEGHVLWTKKSQPTTFRQNAGLDKNRDSTITKGEAAAKVAALLPEGFRPGNMAYYEPRTAQPEPELIVEVPASELPPPVPVATSTGDGVNIPTSAPLPAPPSTPVVERVKTAVSGAAGNFAGIAAIAGALLLNPDFAAQLGRFTTGLASGEGSWGALLALVGAALLAYRRTPSP